MKHERICIVCGKHYEYCPVCGKYDPDEQWRFIYCGEECKGIYRIVCDVEMDIITKEEGAKKLADVKLPQGAPLTEKLAKIVPQKKSRAVLNKD